MRPYPWLKRQIPIHLENEQTFEIWKTSVLKVIIKVLLLSEYVKKRRRKKKKKTPQFLDAGTRDCLNFSD